MTWVCDFPPGPLGHFWGNHVHHQAVSHPRSLPANFAARIPCADPNKAGTRQRKRPYVMLTSNFWDVSSLQLLFPHSKEVAGKRTVLSTSPRFPPLVSIGFYRWRSTSSGLSLRHWSASALKHLLILRCCAQDDLEIYKTQWPAISEDSSYIVWTLFQWDALARKKKFQHPSARSLDRKLYQHTIWFAFR